ncbi:MAG: propionyl-CoA synthetase [Rhizobiales bacterium]|nr:propionyl-CoA synthetase [Hyphomicrobiales bacterium]
MASEQGGYQAVYDGWKSNPEGFWRAEAAHLDWIRAPEAIFDAKSGAYGRWFPDAICNTAANCLDRHIAAGRGDQLALIYDSPITGSGSKLTYAQLKREVDLLAHAIRGFGLEKGDRAILYMPMVPEAAIAMLACARLGVIHSVVFGGFAAHELATRIDDAKPKLILSASCGIEPGRVVAYKPLLDRAIEEASHKVETCIVLQRPQVQAELVAGRDHDWAELRDNLVTQGAGPVEAVPLQATDPLYVLYTSGTTGKPKGVVRDNGGHMVALHYSMHALYGMKPGEVFWAASDVGWVVGHSYIVYAPLLMGCTTVLYEGKPVGTPDPGAFWRVIAEHDVKVLFTAPTAFRAIRKEDPKAEHLARYDVKGLKALFLAGERADPDTVKWAEDILKVPVIDHWWQTETGWAIAGNPLGLGMLPVKHGSPTVPMPGYDVQILDEAGKPVEAGKMGSIAIRLPLPPSCLPTLWNADERFRSSYLTEFPGYYNTSDAGYRDADGYLFIMGRTDDIINVAGHRLSTGGMEEVLASHPAVAECAVIGAKDNLKGEVPVGFVVLKSGTNAASETIERECVGLVRDRIGPVAAFKTAIIVNRLPKTRSGKILRGTMKKIADGDAWSMPATIDDPAILEEIARVLELKGIKG